MPKSLITLGGKKLLDPSGLVSYSSEWGTPRDWMGKANSYECPIGSDAGEGWALITREELDKLDIDASHKMKFDDGKTSAEIQALYIVRAHAVTLIFDSDKKAAYLVELADKRRIAEMSHVNAQYNVRMPAPSTTSGAGLYYVDSLDSGPTIWTWETLFQDLWDTHLGSMGAAPSLPYAPDGTPENFRFVGVSAWRAIEELLDKIGCKVKYQPLTDTFTVVVSAPEADLAARMNAVKKRLIYDYDPKVAGAANLPKQITVLFRKAGQYGTERDTVRGAGNEWELNAIHSVTVNTGSTGALANTNVCLWDDLTATITSETSSTPSNSGALTTRATEVAAEYVDALEAGNGRKKKRYSGVVTTILPDTEVSLVRWRNHGDQGHQGGLVTEVEVSPRHRMRSPADKPTKGSGLITRGEILTPAAISDAIRPTWPRTDQMVQVWDGSTDSLEAVAENASGLIPGRVAIRKTAGTVQTQDDCWIRYNSFYPGMGGSTALPSKEYYQGRLYGYETHSGDTRPSYIVHEATKIYRAQISTEISAGGSGDGVIQPSGPTVTVHNSWADCDIAVDASASTPEEVFIGWFPEDQKWRIIERCMPGIKFDILHQNASNQHFEIYAQTLDITGTIAGCTSDLVTDEGDDEYSINEDGVYSFIWWSNINPGAIDTSQGARDSFHVWMEVEAGGGGFAAVGQSTESYYQREIMSGGSLPSSPAGFSRTSTVPGVAYCLFMGPNEGYQNFRVRFQGAWVNTSSSALINDFTLLIIKMPNV